MKAFGVFLIILGVLASVGGGALAFLPIAYDSPSGVIDCGGFVPTSVAGGTLYLACLPSLLTYAWMVPAVALGGIVLLLIGALMLQSTRIRSFRETLAYSRFAAPAAAVTDRSRATIGTGAPVPVATGVTSSAQAQYAAQAGYRNGGGSAPVFTPPPMTAAAPPAAPGGMAYPGVPGVAPAPAYAAAAPAPQRSAGGFVEPAAPQHAPAPAPAPVAQPVHAAQPAAPVQQPVQQPAPQPGGFVQPSGGVYLPQAGQPVGAY